MNERIKECLEQSTFLCMGMKQVNQEKFAELIVRECADLVDDHDDSYPYVTFGDMIKKHFRVEE